MTPEFLRLRRPFKAVRRLIPAFLSISVLAVVGPATSNIVTSSASASTVPVSANMFPSSAAGALHGPFQVHGNTIVDSAGKPVYLHGANWPSLDWSCTGQWASGGTSGINPSEFQQMATQWGVNSVRIPVNEGFWLSNSGAYCPSYQATVAKVVSLVESYGMVPIIDLHTGMGGDLSAKSSPSAPVCAPDSGSTTFWKQVAVQYRSDPQVMFELYNEPHGVPWSIWRNGGSIACSSTGQSYHAVGMQELLNSVRYAGANNIVMADGIDFASNLTEVPRFALSGFGVAYVYHLYVNESSPSSAATWTTQLGGTPALFPVVATEFGTLGCQSPYPGALEQKVLDYLTANGIGYTAWGWWNGGCSFPSLISSENGTCFEGGCIVQSENLGLSDGSKSATLSPTITPVNSSGVLASSTVSGGTYYPLQTVGGGGKVYVTLGVPTTDRGKSVTASLSSSQGTMVTTSVKVLPGEFLLPLSTESEQGATGVTLSLPAGVTVSNITELPGASGTMSNVLPGSPTCEATSAWGQIAVSGGNVLSLTVNGAGYPAAYIASQACIPSNLGYASASVYYPGTSGTVSVTPFYFNSSWQMQFGTQFWLSHGWNNISVYTGESTPIKLGLQIDNQSGWSGTLQVAGIQEVS